MEKQVRSADGILVGMPSSGKAKRMFRTPFENKFVFASDNPWSLLVASIILPQPSR